MSLGPSYLWAWRWGIEAERMLGRTWQSQLLGEKMIRNEIQTVPYL